MIELHMNPAADRRSARRPSRLVRLGRTLGIALALALAAIAPRTDRAAAQVTTSRPAVANGETVPVVPGPGYSAGGLHRTILGSGWRDLWTTPVEAQVFSFDRFAGGVTWTERGGGNQSITLHLESTDDWREYIFRSVDKFPRQALPPALMGTAIGWAVDDLISAMFPAAPLLVPPFLEALDILHVDPVLRVMPDDPRLEVYQDTFAGMLGTVELQPNEAPDDEPGFAGSRKIKGTEEFLNDIEDSKTHRLDEREFLAVRLVDLLINDSDRTRDNMRWVRTGEEGDYHWRPLPIDRDWAFVDAGGWIAPLTRTFYPKFVGFGPEYASIGALAYSAYLLDRRLLQRLTRQDFAEVAERVRTAITDDVIEAAIDRLPERWRTETDAPERLREALRSRRDRIPDIAMEFYDHLIYAVDIRGTDEADQVVVERYDDGRVRVTITWPDDHDRAGEIFYDRTFDPSETKDVRVYLHGGDDEGRVIGEDSRSIVVRLIGGGGDDLLADQAGGGDTYLYDARGDNRILPTTRTQVSRKAWDPPVPTEGLRLGGDWAPDFGSGIGWSPAVDYDDAAGVIIGLGPSFTSYGFRSLPHKWKVGGRLLYAIGDNSFGAELSADYRLENSPLAITVGTRATPFEAFRFNGYGNDAPDVGEPGLVQEDRIAANAALVWFIGWRDRETGQFLVGPQQRSDSGEHLRPLVGRLEVGPTVLWSDPRPEEDAPLVTGNHLGADGLTRLGLRTALRLDRTDQDALPRRGWRLDASAAGYPAGADLTEGFAEAGGQLGAYIPLYLGGTHAALQAGGSVATGAFPVQHSPFVGGRTTLRGHRWQRYRGDAAAFGSAELRVPLAPVELVARWDSGVFGLADVGQVWVDGESPGGWHTGFGAGIWLHALGNVVSAAWARGEADRFYLELGFSF